MENILNNYAVVENGIITNVLIFDSKEDAKKFGCFPMSQGQGIGDKYITPYTPTFEETATAKIKAVSDRQDFLEDCIAEMATQVYS